jgi:pimeloyl-ACP methyl ester carboxylesterase
MPSESILISAEDGTRLHVRLSRHADSSRPTCLLLHGYGDGSYVWADACAALSDVCKVVVVDLRGHGDSEPSRSGAYDADTGAGDVRTIIAQLELASPILIGHSFGGELVLRLAARPVPDVAAAVFVDICPEANQEASRQATVLMRETLRTYGSIEDYCNVLMSIRPILSKAAAERLAHGSLRPVEGGFQLKLDPALIDSADEEFTTAAQWRELLPGIRCPTLVVRGAASAMVSASCAAQMARMLAKARVVTVPKAGHAVMSDNPAAFCADIVGFVNSIAVAANRPHG